MDDSSLALLPREIRDQIYSYVLLGIGQSIHQNTRCSPAYYLHSSCIKPLVPSSKVQPPNIFAVTARDHPLLATCCQLSTESFDSFLAKNEFIQDILVPSLALSACKSLGLFVKGLGNKAKYVRRMGLAIEDPDVNQLHLLLDYLIKLAKTNNLRSGALVLQIKTSRHARSPALFSPCGEAWSIAPRDQETMTLDLIIGDEKASWRSFAASMDRDWMVVQQGTERVLSVCQRLEMKGVKERRVVWQEERMEWWEETRRCVRGKFQGWLETMEGLQKQDGSGQFP